MILCLYEQDMKGIMSRLTTTYQVYDVQISLLYPISREPTRGILLDCVVPYELS